MNAEHQYAEQAINNWLILNRRAELLLKRDEIHEAMTNPNLTPSERAANITASNVITSRLILINQSIKGNS